MLKRLVLFSAIPLALPLACFKPKAGSSQSAAEHAQTGPGQESCASRTLALAQNAALTDDPAPRANTLAIEMSQAFVTDLSSLLAESGLRSDQAAFIAAGAQLETSTALGTLAIGSDPLPVVAPAVVKGAFFSLTDACAGGDDDALRLKIADAIMVSATRSIGRSRAQASPDGALGAVHAASKAAVAALPQARLGGELAPKALGSMTAATIATIAGGGFDERELGKAAKAVTSGAVAGLAEHRMPAPQLGGLAGIVATSAVEGIGRAGLTAPRIIELQIIIFIVSGTSSGLTAAGVSAATAGSSLAGIAAAVTGGLVRLAGGSSEVLNGAIADVIAGAVDGAYAVSVTVTLTLADLIGAVAEAVVAAFPGAGIKAADAATSTAVVVETGLERLLTVPGTDAASAVAAASQLIEGAMAAIAAQTVQGYLDPSQALAAVSLTTAGAIEGLAALQEAGIVSQADGASAWLEAIKAAVAAGFAAGGASTELVSSATSAAAEALAPASSARASLTVTAGDEWSIPLVGATAQRAYTVENSGTASASQLELVTQAPFSLTGTCGKTLAAGERCRVDVLFTPTGVAEVAEDLVVTYFDGIATATLAERLESRAIDFTLSGDLDLGVVPVGGTSSRQLTITNAATEPQDFSFGALSAGFATGDHDCVGVASGASCQVTVTFTPSTSGGATADLEVSAGSASKVFGLTATGKSPALLTFDAPSQAAFSGVWTTSTASVVFTLSNIGETTATGISDVSLPGAFTRAATTCDVTLAPSTSCQITIEFAPTAPQSYTGTMSVSYHDGFAAGTATKGLTATGTTPASLSFNSPSQAGLADVAVGGSSAINFTLTNSGSSPATGLGVPSLPSGFTTTSTTCGSSLAAGASCQLVLSFAPTSAGDFSGSISVSYHTGLAAAAVTKSVTASGKLPASLSFDSPSQAAWSNVHYSANPTVTFTLSNSGGLAATGLGALSLPTDFFQQSTTCGATLSSGASCQYVVRFHPRAVSRSGTMSVSYDTGAGVANATLAVSGTGVESAVLDYDDPSVASFQNVLVGEKRSIVFTVTNTSPTSLAATQIQSLPLVYDPFHISAKTCGTSLNQGEQCTVTLVFAPESAGTFTTDMSWYYDNTIGWETLRRDVTATAKAPARLALTSQDFSALMDVWLPGTASTTLTLTNQGDVAATGITPGSLGTYLTLTSVDCTTTLAPGASCQYTVNFTPDTRRDYSRVLSIAYDDGIGPTTLEQLITATTGPSVTPLYPVAPQWMDFAAAGSNASCPDSGVPCDHGGEYRKIRLPASYVSCAGLTASDSLGWFDWRCVDAGDHLEFRTKRLRLAVRLEDMLDVVTDAGHPTWKKNKVTISQGGSPVEETELTRWWTNPIVNLPDTSVAASPNYLDANVPYVLRAPGTIHIATGDVTTKGLKFIGDGQGLLVFRNKAMVLDLASGIIDSLLNGAGVDPYYSQAGRMWIEGEFDANGKANRVLLISGDDNRWNSNLWTIRHASFSGGSWNPDRNHPNSAVLAFGDRHRFENVQVTNNGDQGLVLDGNYDFLHDVKITNNGSLPMIAAWDSASHMIHNLLVANNREGVLIGNPRSHNNAITRFLVVNNEGFYPAFSISWLTSGNNVISGAILNNRGEGLSIGNGSAGNHISQIRLAKNGNGIVVAGNAGFTTFSDNIYGQIGAYSNSWEYTNEAWRQTHKACVVNNGTSSLVADLNDANNCVLNTGVTDLNFVQEDPSIGSTFVGYVGVNGDAANSADDAAAQPAAAAITSVGQWARFDNFFRAWTRSVLDGSSNPVAFPDFDLRDRCVSMNCQIFDYRLVATDTVLRNKVGTPAEVAWVDDAACPAAVHGDEYKSNPNTFFGGPSKFLTNAIEIVDDALGDNNGLCETGEACIFTPNLGVYQGEGDYTAHTCVFQGSATDGVTSVTMYAYPTNGI